MRDSEDDFRLDLPLLLSAESDEFSIGESTRKIEAEPIYSSVLNAKQRIQLFTLSRYGRIKKKKIHLNSLAL